MGKLEESVRKQVRKTKITNALIAAAAVSGGVAVAALVPNVLGVIARSTYARQRRYQLKSSLSRLISAGYLQLAEEKGVKRVHLTTKGEVYAALLGQGKLVPKKPRRWDRKWRLLIFDIPEKKRVIRRRIRSTLTMLGFVRLQDSVWVCPYDCEDLITLIKADLRVGKDILYVIADKIEYDKPLITKFGLR
jgi:DNA-binding transcriptional regulator PaaX